MKLRCRLGIHARYHYDDPRGLRLQQYLMCRYCPARWRLTALSIGGDRVISTERLPDRPQER